MAIGDFDKADLTVGAGVDAENDQLSACANRAPVGATRHSIASPRWTRCSDSLTTVNSRQRAADIVKIEKLAVTDMPYIFLYYTSRRLAWNPQLQRTPSNITDDWYEVQRWSFTRP